MDLLFNNYFNNVLRDHLSYPETFKITFDLNKITLLPNKPSGLLKSIKTNPTLKTKLINQISIVLNKYYSNQVDEVYLSTHSNDIIINYSIKSERIEVLPIELYSVIFSYSAPDDVLTFESSNHFINITEDPKFWINLVSFKFGEYLRPFEKIQNYSDFYYGISEYSNINKIKPTIRYTRLLELLKTFTRKYPLVAKYLLKTHQINGDFTNKSDLIFIIDDLELFQSYILDLKEQYKNALKQEDLGPQIFDYLFTLSGYNYNLEDVSEALIQLYESGDHTDKLIEYIVDRLIKSDPNLSGPNLNKERLYQFFSDATMGTDIHALTLLWSKYGHLFTPREIKELNKQTVNHYYETGDESLINFFGNPMVKVEDYE